MNKDGCRRGVRGETKAVIEKQQGVPKGGGSNYGKEGGMETISEERRCRAWKAGSHIGVAGVERTRGFEPERKALHSCEIQCLLSQDYKSGALETFLSDSNHILEHPADFSYCALTCCQKSPETIPGALCPSPLSGHLFCAILARKWYPHGHLN